MFEAGTRDATAHRFDLAAREFSCSYRLVPTAQAAYNTGTAFVQLGRTSDANVWFSRYLVLAPFADDRREIEARLASPSPASRAPPAASRALASAPAARSTVITPGLTTRQAIGLGLVVGGIDAAVVGTVLHVIGWSDASEAHSDPSFASQAHTMDVAGTSLWVGGAVVVVLGIATMVLGRGRTPDAVMTAEDGRRSARGLAQGRFE